MSKQSEIVTRYGPSNGASFTENQLIDLAIPPRDFVCLTESYFTLDIALTSTAGTPAFDEDAGAFGVLDEMVTRADNTDIENLNNIGLEVANKQRVSASHNGINGYRMISQGVDDEGNVTQTWVLPLSAFSGVFAKATCWPLKIMKQGLTIRIKLASNTLAISQASTDPTPITDGAFTVSNVFLTVSEKNIPDATREEYSAYIMDRYNKDGVMLNFITCSQTINNATSALVNPVFQLSPSSNHHDCVASFTMAFDTSKFNDIDDRTKFLPIKDSPGGNSSYQFRIGGVNTPNSKVSTSKAYNQIANNELANAYASIGVPVTNWESLDNSDTIIYARSFAGANRALDLLNKEFTLLLNLSSPAVTKTYYTWTYFVRTIMLRPGSVEVMD